MRKHPILIDLKMCPKAEEFVRLEKLHNDYPDKFSFLTFAAKSKIQLWKHLGLKCSENEEYEIKNGVLIISEYEKV